MIPDSKVHGANMGPIWGRQDPGGPHGGPMNFAFRTTRLDTPETSISQQTITWYEYSYKNINQIALNLARKYEMLLSIFFPK